MDPDPGQFDTDPDPGKMIWFRIEEIFINVIKHSYPLLNCNFSIYNHYNNVKVKVTFF